MLARNANTWQYTNTGSLPQSIRKGAVFGRWQIGIKSKIVTGVLLFLCLLSIPYVMNGLFAQKGYNVQQARSRVVDLVKENEVLRLEVNQLKSPRRIEYIAETQLGMFTPTNAINCSVAAKNIQSEEFSKPIRD